MDEETFSRVFGRTDWAVMAIVACGGQSSARLRFQAGPGGALRLPLEVDFQIPFAASDHAAWTEEYDRCVQATEKILFAEDPFLQPWLPEDEGCFDLPRPNRRRLPHSRRQ